MFKWSIRILLVVGLGMYVFPELTVQIGHELAQGAKDIAAGLFRSAMDEAKESLKDYFVESVKQGYQQQLVDPVKGLLGK